MRRSIAGVRFYPVRFTPISSKYANEACQGVFMIVTDRAALRPVRLGLEVAAALNKLYGAKFELESAQRLFGSKDTLTRVRAARIRPLLRRPGAPGKRAGACCRAGYLLYR